MSSDNRLCLLSVVNSKIADVTNYITDGLVPLSVSVSHVSECIGTVTGT